MKKNNIFNLVLGFLVIPFIIGIILIIASNIISSNMNKYDNIESGIVTKVDDEKAYIQVGEENGDPIIYEIDNIKNIKKGETITIGIKNNKAKYMSEPIDTDDLMQVGYMFIMAPFILFFALILLMCIVFLPISVIKSNKLSLLESIMVILFVVGSVILYLFAETNKIDKWMISGLSLIIGSSCVIAFLDYKKK